MRLVKVSVSPFSISPEITSNLEVSIPLLGEAIRISAADKKEGIREKITIDKINTKINLVFTLGFLRLLKIYYALD